jgi:hypothetical protein
VLYENDGCMISANLSVDELTVDRALSDADLVSRIFSGMPALNKWSRLAARLAGGPSRTAWAALSW